MAAHQRHVMSLMIGTSLTMAALGSPQPVSAAEPSRSAPVLAMGYSHSCAFVGGEVRCWGANSNMQLGDGTTLDRKDARPVVGLPQRPVVALAVAGYHSCAALADGAVWCWGSQSSAGFMGVTGKTPYRVGPTKVRGVADAVSVAASMYTTCAVERQGRVLCWGRDHYALGVPEAKVSEVPVAIPGVPAARRVIALGQNLCAITHSHELWCWGMERPDYFDGKLKGLRPSRKATQVDRVSKGTWQCSISSGGAIRCTTKHVDPIRLNGPKKDATVAFGVADTQLCLSYANAEVQCTKLPEPYDSDARKSWQPAWRSIQGTRGLAVHSSQRGAWCGLARSAVKCWNRKQTKPTAVAWRSRKDLARLDAELKARRRLQREAARRDVLLAAATLARTLKTTRAVTSGLRDVAMAMAGSGRVSESTALYDDVEALGAEAVERRLRRGECAKAFSLYNAYVARNPPTDLTMRLARTCAPKVPAEATTLLRRLLPVAREKGNSPLLAPLVEFAVAANDAALRSGLLAAFSKPLEKARAQHRLGDPATAVSTIQGMAQKARRSLPVAKRAKKTARGRLGVLFGGLGANKKKAKKKKEPTSVGPFEDLLAATRALSDVGTTAQALGHAKAALAWAGRIRDLPTRAWALTETAGVLAKLDRRSAVKALSKARKAARKLPPRPKPKRTLLTAIGSTSVLGMAGPPELREVAFDAIAQVSARVDRLTRVLNDYAASTTLEASAAAIAKRMYADKQDKRLLTFLGKESFAGIARQLLTQATRDGRCAAHLLGALAAKGAGAIYAPRTMAALSPRCRAVYGAIGNTLEQRANKKPKSYGGGQLRIAAAILKAKGGDVAAALTLVASIDFLPYRVDALAAVGRVWQESGAVMTPQLEAALAKLLP